MVLEKLGSSLRSAIRKIVNATHVDKVVIRELVKDVQRALLHADVRVEMALDLTRKVESRALTEKPPAGMSSKEHVVRILYEELVKILGKSKEFKLQRQKILLVGLYGQGKTTTAGKLGRYFQKRGLKVALVAGDTHRPAAFDQLSQIAQSLNLPIYGDPREKRAKKIVKKGIEKFKDFDVLIIDTSGRHSLEDELIEEIKRLNKIVIPDETILVMDASMGQQAGPQAKAFHEAVGITSVILAKMDGSAKGGGALSAVSETKAPIVFIGTGEKLEDLEKFEPPRFISRLLGMGDIEALIERASEVISEEKAEETAKKLLSGKFTLRDMYEQMEMLTGMGPLSKLMSLIPGMQTRLSEEDVAETQAKLARFRVIMDSMTEEELNDPRVIKSSRIKRIARGSGHSLQEVRELLKHYKMSRTAIKGLAGNRKMRRQLLKRLKAGGFE